MIKIMLADDDLNSQMSISRSVVLISVTMRRRISHFSKKFLIMFFHNDKTTLTFIIDNIEGIDDYLLFTIVIELMYSSEFPCIL